MTRNGTDENGAQTTNCTCKLVQHDYTSSTTIHRHDTTITMTSFNNSYGQREPSACGCGVTCPFHLMTLSRSCAVLSLSTIQINLHHQFIILPWSAQEHTGAKSFDYTARVDHK